jgi:hypothetical protein
MKKIHILFAVAILGLLTSCLKDQEDVFDKQSAIRAEEAIAADYKILAGAEHGWLLKYYPSPYRTYGGYCVLMKFTEDGKVTVASDIAKPTVTADSYYKIAQSAGIVLSFDTYNEIFHLFSTPDAPLGGATGKGWEGDYDFEFISASSEKIVLKGKKSGNYATMVPFKDDDWAGYLSNNAVVEEDMNFPKYSMDVAGTEVAISKSHRSFEMTYATATNDTTISVPFVVSDAGIEFYEPIQINGKEISGFKYVENTFDFPSISDESIVLKGIVPPINATLVGDLWACSLSNMGTFGTPYWEDIRDNIMPQLGETLNYFYFGLNSAYWGFTFNSGGYAGVIGFQYELVGDDKIKLAYYPKGNYSNGDWYVNNAYFHYLTVPFGCDEEANPVVRTFTLTCDNPKSPSWIQLADDNNPDNVITVWGKNLDPFND